MNTQREQLIQTWLQAVLQSDQFEISFWQEMQALPLCANQVTKQNLYAHGCAT